MQTSPFATTISSSSHHHAAQQQLFCSSTSRNIRKTKHRPGPFAVAAGAANGTHDCLPLSRRQLLQASSVVPLLLPVASILPGAAFADNEQPAPPSAAPSAAAQEGDSSLQQFVNSQQQYQISIPGNWEQKGKAGADVLFEDPSRRSTSVGVTVSPVRVSSIQQFGSLEAVGQRLLDVERKKESTLDVSLLSSASRTGAAGATLYDYEYQLDSTRGIKRIFNSVTITGSKLYIMNGNYKCDKEAGCAAAEGSEIALLRTIASTFDAGSVAAQ